MEEAPPRPIQSNVLFKFCRVYFYVWEDLSSTSPIYTLWFDILRFSLITEISVKVNLSIFIDSLLVAFVLLMN